jgi:hypothetical protein
MEVANPASTEATSKGSAEASGRVARVVTVSAFHAFSPTTTGNAESRTRLSGGAGWDARYCVMSVDPLSSSVPTSRRIVCVRFCFVSFNTFMASNACTSGPLSSAEPRPSTWPSRTSPPNGGKAHASSSTGTTSPCTTSPSTGAAAGPGSSTSTTGPASRTVNPRRRPTSRSHAFWAAWASAFPAKVGKRTTSASRGTSCFDSVVSKRRCRLAAGAAARRPRTMGRAEIMGLPLSRSGAGDHE